MHDGKKNTYLHVIAPTDLLDGCLAAYHVQMSVFQLESRPIAHTWAMLPTFGLHEVIQLIDTIARVLGSSLSDGLLTALAPHMPTSWKGTSDVL
jgi:hypothetical protein